jgi:hypothetical protein
METAIEFFEKVVGRPPSPAEEAGNVSLPVLLMLIDAKVIPPKEEVVSENPGSAK